MGKSKKSDDAEGVESAKPDERRKTIEAVWTAAIGLFFLSIPLVIATRMASLPLVVLAAAALTTVVVWAGGRRKDGGVDSGESEALRERIRELEERLANVEVINAFESRLAEKEAERRSHEGDGMPGVSEPRAGDRGVVGPIEDTNARKEESEQA